jgi:hypothetical protein
LTVYPELTPGKQYVTFKAKVLNSKNIISCVLVCFRKCCFVSLDVTSWIARKKTPGFISMLKMSTGGFQFAAPERHHPTGTLETVQFGVSNVPGGLLGPQFSQVGDWPSSPPPPHWFPGPRSQVQKGCDYQPSKKNRGCLGLRVDWWPLNVLTTGRYCTCTKKVSTSKCMCVQVCVHTHTHVRGHARADGDLKPPRPLHSHSWR